MPALKRSCIHKSPFVVLISHNALALIHTSQAIGCKHCLILQVGELDVDRLGIEALEAEVAVPCHVLCVK